MDGFMPGGCIPQADVGKTRALSVLRTAWPFMLLGSLALYAQPWIFNRLDESHRQFVGWGLLIFVALLAAVAGWFAMRRHLRWSAAALAGSLVPVTMFLSPCLVWIVLSVNGSASIPGIGSVLYSGGISALISAVPGAVAGVLGGWLARLQAPALPSSAQRGP